MPITLGIVLCLACGFALVSLFSPRRIAGLSDVLFKLSLSVGFGLGIFSIIVFLTDTWGAEKMASAQSLGAKRSGLIIFDGILLAFLTAAVLLCPPHPAPPASRSFRRNDGNWPLWFQRVLALSTWVTFCGALYAAIMQALAHPMGQGLDCFAIWNLRARFLFLGGSRWRDGLSTLISWSHPDYPLLVPGAVAHLWAFIEYDDARVPEIVGLIMTFASVALLFSTLSILRGRIAAMFGALALLSTPFFIEQGTWQYADIPLAFFLLATIALLAISDEQFLGGGSPDARFLVLAGIAAGFAAWTKNEGVLFLCATILARQIVFLRARRKAESNISLLHHSAGFLLGCAPLILLVIYFKRRIAPPGDLFTTHKGMLDRLLDLTRFETVLKAFSAEFFHFGDWLAVPGTVLLLIFYFVAARSHRGKVSPGQRASALALFITFLGYFLVYLITPYELSWHLRFSLDRLFLQLWPGTLFLFFCNYSQNSLTSLPVSK